MFVPLLGAIGGWDNLVFVADVKPRCPPNGQTISGPGSCTLMQYSNNVEEAQELVIEFDRSVLFLLELGQRLERLGR